MKNRLIKITVALTMMLALAVPTQAFAAENCDAQTTALKNTNYSKIYDQIKEQFSKAGLPVQFTQQPKKTNTVKQPPAQPAQRTAQTNQAPAVNDAQPATTVANPAAPVSGNVGAYEQQVVDLVNRERAAAGLSALKMNTNLAGVAERKAEDLRDKNYFDHNSPTYGSPFDMMKQFGIKYTAAGENIAKGQRTPADVMNGWMNSPGHRANIMNANFTEIGVGYVTDSNGGTYWVQMFIRP